MFKVNLTIYFACVIGIVISIVLPILRGLLPRPPVAAAAAPPFLTVLWNHAKPYLVVGLFSLLTAFLIVVLVGDTLATVKAALLAGYAWDSTLQKLTKP